ncbi:FecR family protein [Methylomonas sp. EFPC1]|uniref:FecR family protein n=1 Tax=unclassified Methylomonas TaxID=2608980 RepID=UPI00051B2A49|nr:MULTISPECIES: FecR family protein [unclassified Methylomonas]PKD38404.1 histidine kinase [Methylomonas sp. Kb3]QBC28871.1 FecR family protein [Methylomonas sp. LW13]QSB00472.1 FecR family protein [Methylomonas sp. EFPC1]
MTAPKLSQSPKILQQAATWFVELQSESCDEQRRQAFAQWLLQNPAHQTAYDDIASLWGNLDELKTAEVAGLNTARSARPRVWRNGKMLTVSLLLATVLTGAWLDFKAPSRVYQTGIGERQTVQLADGSQLQLNTDTQLRVRLSWWRREIELQQGEAMFNVAHQAWHPFTVHTGNLQIKDIGTVFNVRHDNHGTAVSVLEGEVALHAGRSWFGENLPAGFSRKIDAGGHWQKPEKTNTKQVAAWLNGQLLFDHTPLTEVVAELERYHAVRFAFADPALAKQTLSGSFNSADLKPFLQALEKILPIRVQRQKQTVVLYSR